MKCTLILLVLTTTTLLSCKRSEKRVPNAVRADLEAVESTEKVIPQEPREEQYNNSYIDTQYQFNDADNNYLTIENSLPKGGLRYTQPDGKEFVYAIFWTRITNGTDNPVEFSINFPTDSFAIPTSLDTYFKLHLPPETMGIDKETLFNYGLTNLEALLDKGLNHSSILHQTIAPRGSHSFYIVTLFNRGLKGVVRAGLFFKDGKLYYRVNGTEILSGQYHIKNMKP